MELPLHGDTAGPPQRSFLGCADTAARKTKISQKFTSRHTCKRAVLAAAG